MSINVWGLVKTSACGDGYIPEYFVFHAKLQYPPSWM